MYFGGIGADARHPGDAAAHGSCRARAITVARTCAVAATDGAEKPEAEGAFAVSPAAATCADAVQATEACVGSDLIACERADRILHITAQGVVRTKDRRG